MVWVDLSTLASRSQSTTGSNGEAEKSNDLFLEIVAARSPSQVSIKIEKMLRSIE